MGMGQVLFVKTRLNISIDAALASGLKRVARQRNTTVSALVEELLRTTMKAPDNRNIPFSLRWAGRFRPAPKDASDMRLCALFSKHRLG
jgi:hypothetical protein